jgi:uncharacterized membrane protein YgcG
MVMRQARVVRTGAFALCALALFGCAKTGDNADVEGPVGSARFSVQTVPTDVSCISVTADGSRDRTQLFDATPNQSAEFTMPALPAGSVTFTAEAFPVKCSKVSSATLPTWVSDPVTADITPGGVTSVKLIMRPVGSAGSGGTGGGAGSGGSGGAAGSGGGTSLPPGVWDTTNWDNAVWQ